MHREEDITGYVLVNVQGGYLMGIDASMEPSCFVMDVLVSTRIPTTVNKLAIMFCNVSLIPCFYPFTCLLLSFHICLFFDS